MLMFARVAAAELPATSTHALVTDCPAPAVETMASKGGLPAASPEPPSEHVKLTVTSVLFQPLAFGGGDWTP